MSYPIEFSKMLKMLEPNVGRDVGRSETSACTGESVKDTAWGVSSLFSLKLQERKMGKLSPWGLLGKLWQYAYAGMLSIRYNEQNRRINVDIFGNTNVKQKNVQEAFVPKKEQMGLSQNSSSYNFKLPLHGAQIQSLVREIKFHMPHDVAKII